MKENEKKNIQNESTVGRLCPFVFVDRSSNTVFDGLGKCLRLFFLLCWLVANIYSTI